MASREELLQSIQPSMKLDKAFFLKVYGYEITWPGFRDQAIGVLESVGCSNARRYYEEIVGEYQRNQEESLRPVAAAYVKECSKEWERKTKGSDQQRKQQKDQIMKNLEKMNDGDLLKLWQQQKLQSREVF